MISFHERFPPGCDGRKSCLAADTSEVRGISKYIHIYCMENTPGLVANLDAFQRSNHCILHSVVLCGAPRGDYPGAVEAVSERAEPEARARLTE